jgi:hypothetical protein
LFPAVSDLDEFEAGAFISSDDLWKLVGIEGTADQSRFGRDRNRAMEELGFVPLRPRIGNSQTRGFFKPVRNSQGVPLAPTKRIVVAWARPGTAVKATLEELRLADGAPDARKMTGVSQPDPTL